MANRYGLGSAEFQLTANNEPMLRAFAQAEVAARTNSAKIASAIAQAEGAATKADQAIVGMGKAMAGAALAVVGLTSATNTLTQAIHASIEASLRQKQVNFELAQTYKLQTAEYTKFAQALGEQTNRTTTEVKASITAFGVLRQNYKLTSDQIKTLTTLTAAYSAKSGRDMEQSARDVQAAIRGEGEAVEKLGLTLGRDFVRNVGLMTEAQRKHFYTISDSERAVLLYTAALKQYDEFSTTIADRRKSELGIYDRLNKENKELQETYGNLITKALAPVIPLLADQIDHLEKLPSRLEKVAYWIQAITAYLIGNEIAARRAAVALGHVPEGIQVGPDFPGAGTPPHITPEQIAATAQAINDITAKAGQAQDALETQLKAALQQRLESITEQVDATKRAIDEEIRQENERFRDLQQNARFAKEAAVQAANDRKDEATRILEEEREAEKEAHDARMIEIRLERDEALQASEKKKDQALRAIEVEKEAVIDAAEEQIRQLEIARDARIQLAEETRDQALEVIEVEKTAALDAIDERIEAERAAKEDAVRIAEDEKEEKLEKIAEEEQNRNRYYERRIDREEKVKQAALRNAEEEKEGKLAQLEEEERRREQFRLQEDRAIEDGKDAIKRARELQDRRFDTEQEGIERRRDLQDRALDDQRESELRALEARDSDIEDSYKKEQELARETTEAILRELDNRERQNESLHRQTLDQIQREKEARLEEIESRLSATDSLLRAFQNQNKLTDLGQDLTIAQRKGDITEVRRVEEEIRRERIRQSYQEAREALQVQKKAVNDELDERRRAAEERNRIEKSAIDEERRLAKAALDETLKDINVRNERVKSTYDSEKQQIKDKYDAYKRALADQRFAEDEAFQARLVQIEDQRYIEDQEFERRQRQLQDLRKAEDDAFERRKEVINDAYEDEKEQIEGTHERRVERLKQQQQDEKDTFDRRKQTVADAYQDERRRLDDLYDDPQHGILARLRDNRTQTEREYKAKADAVAKTYEAERRDIQATYNDEATGAIPAIKRMIASTRTEYEERARIVNENYKNEQEQIHLTYDHPTEGLIARQEAAHASAVKEYNARAAAIQAAYEAEQRNIYNTYDGPNGIITKQQQQHDQIMKNLDVEKRRWEQWATDTNREIRKILDGPLKDFVNKLEELEKRGFIVPGAVQRPGGGGDGPGPTVGQGVPGSPYNVLFPYNAPYNGPYGGAMWAGGPTRHRGIDLTLPGQNHGRGSPIGAFRNGRVETLTDEDAGGRGIIFRGEDGLFEYYGHLDSVNVRQGQEVRRGDLIGTLGATGLEPWQTPHLHYEVRRNANGDPVGRTIDPVPYMGGMTNTIGGSASVAGEVLELRPFGPNGAVVVIRATTAGPAAWEQKAYQAAKDVEFSDPFLFARQMRHESAGFDPRVIRGEKKSEAGAIGIAQFMPDTAKALGVNPYDPIMSLYAAARYMRHLERTYAGLHGNTGTRNALWAYNAGEGNLQRGIMPGQTRQYLDILQGYAAGKLVTEPTLMVGMRTGQMGIAGETGQPERLLGVAATSAYDQQGSPQSVQVPVVIGDSTIADVIIRGHHLIVESGRNVNLPGFAQ